MHFTDYVVLADTSTASQNKLKALLLVSLGWEGCEILDGLLRWTASMIIAIDLMNASAANHLPYLTLERPKSGFT